MKVMIRGILVIVLIAVMNLSACSTWKKLNSTEQGAVIGGGSGAIVGDLVAPGVGGTVVGGAIGAVGGGLIGHEVDEDKKKGN